MRYVCLAVAIGLLVIVTGFTGTEAAQAKAAIDSRLIFGLGPGTVTRFAGSVHSDVFMRASAAYAAKLEWERRDREAAERYGAWGPDLVRAAAMYGQDPEKLYRVMLCESSGKPNADNGICKGLFQFNPGTWAGTPFGNFDIFDGQAQIYAAAWMFSQGRQGEWVCQ